MNSHDAIAHSITTGLIDFCKKHDIEQDISSELIDLNPVAKPTYLTLYNRFLGQGMGEVHAHTEAMRDLGRQI